METASGCDLISELRTRHFSGVIDYPRIGAKGNAHYIWPVDDGKEPVRASERASSKWLQGLEGAIYVHNAEFHGSFWILGESFHRRVGIGNAGNGIAQCLIGPLT